MQTKNHYSKASSVFDWLFIFFSGWWIAGVFLDGWAHIHLDQTLETVFTPWHGVFYSGIALTAALLFIQLYINYTKGFTLRRCLPREYLFSLLGLALVLIAGPGDLLWHGLFGIEKDIEALLSPTHILLAVGGAIVVSGPLHAIWYRDRKIKSIHPVPAILSFAYLLMTLGFMLQFLHPFNFPWMAQSFVAENPIEPNIAGGLGVANAIVFTVIFMGLTLASIRHWVFPFGSFTVILMLNAIAITLMHGKYYAFVFAAAAAGFFIDILYQKVCSLQLRERHIRLFGSLAPMILSVSYLFTILLTDVTRWSVHMLAGVVAISGITGYLLTYLVMPPGDGVPRVKY